MGFDFKTGVPSFTAKPRRGKRAVAVRGSGTALDDSGMSVRLERESARFDDATDSATWVCLCFDSLGDRALFVALTGLPARRFVTGAELKAATERLVPRKRRFSFVCQTAPGRRAPNPIADLDRGQSSEDLAVEEAMALKRALIASDGVHEGMGALDSGIWICVAFESNSECEEYLDAMDIRKYGDKYVDASRWLACLMSG